MTAGPRKVPLAGWGPSPPQGQTEGEVSWLLKQQLPEVSETQLCCPGEKWSWGDMEVGDTGWEWGQRGSGFGSVCGHTWAQGREQVEASVSCPGTGMRARRLTG